MNQQAGKIVIIAGAIILFAGIVIYFFGNRLGFLGRLPGDIRIERGNSSFYFPLSTSILLSVLISVIYRIIQWFLK
jgi:hypothetical protein